MKKLVDRGFVLRRINYGDSDRVVTFLTEKNGKITVFAKGVRKQKSRLSGGIELFCESELSLVEGKSNLLTLTGSRVISNYDKIVSDIASTSLAYQALKSIEKITEEGTGQEYFDILKKFFSGLNDSRNDKYLVKAWLDINTMKLSGVLGEFSVQIGEKSEANFNYDGEKDSFIAGVGGRFTEQEIKLLKVLYKSSRPVMVENLVDSVKIEQFVSFQLSERLT